MQKNILITGKPKSGKSALLRKLVANVPNKVGFVTNEMLGEQGRIGFEMETHIGRKAILATVNFKTDHQVSKYFVDPNKLDTLIPEVWDFKEDSILYLDEIGQMQLFSEKFKGLVLRYLDSPNTCLATLSYVFEDDFTRSLKKREDVILVELSAEDRETKEEFLTLLLRKIEKARRYIAEPGRFKVDGSQVELKSEHGTRQLTFIDGRWNCTCDFFAQYGICSHAIAVKEGVRCKSIK